MTRQYLRKVSLVVGDQAGDGLDLSELKIVFSVRQWDLQQPTVCEARVYNLAAPTAARIQGEFTRLVLQAGYQEGPFGTIFDGTIVQVRQGRENGTDTYVDITAAEADAAYCFAIVNTSLAAGSTAKDRLDVIAKSMGEHGVSPGYVPELPGGSLPRGKVMFGMARDHMRQLADTTESKWFLDAQTLNMIRLRGVRPGTAVVLSATTGMVGIPEQTQDGIRVRCLLNPEIKVGVALQIANKSINRAALNLSTKGAVQNGFLPRVADDGFYRPIVINHSGDTRGNDFYSDITCIALDDGVTPGLAAKGYG